jgi:threonine dehydrogenase-like Zn-dependent dehydrogenase
VRPGDAVVVLAQGPIGLCATAGARLMGASLVVGVDGDENRLAGIPALPLDINPYRDAWGKHRPVAGAVLPSAGLYDVVFDETGAGRPFSFRLWVDDTKPPTVKMGRTTVAAGGVVAATAADAGAGVDPASVRAALDGVSVSARATGGKITVSIPTATSPGRHTLVLSVGDYQETKNMEDVPRILPNTRTVTARLTVR